MRMVSRLLAGLLGLAAVLPQPAAAQGTAPSAADQAVFLIAAPAFRDPEYRQSVVIASPTASGGHIGRGPSFLALAVAAAERRWRDTKSRPTTTSPPAGRGRTCLRMTRAVTTPPNSRYWLRAC